MRVVRHTDTEMTVMEYDVYYPHRSLETGGPQTGPHGEHQGQPGGGGGAVGKSLSCGFRGKEQARLAKQA